MLTGLAALHWSKNEQKSRTYMLGSDSGFLHLFLHTADPAYFRAQVQQSGTTKNAAFYFDVMALSAIADKQVLLEEAVIPIIAIPRLQEIHDGDVVPAKNLHRHQRQPS
jgi:hypothetical protein